MDTVSHGHSESPHHKIILTSPRCSLSTFISMKLPESSLFSFLFKSCLTFCMSDEAEAVASVKPLMMPSLLRQLRTPYPLSVFYADGTWES